MKLEQIWSNCGGHPRSTYPSAQLVNRSCEVRIKLCSRRFGQGGSMIHRR